MEVKFFPFNSSRFVLTFHVQQDQVNSRNLKRPLGSNANDTICHDGVNQNKNIPCSLGNSTICKVHFHHLYVEQFYLFMCIGVWQEFCFFHVDGSEQYPPYFFKKIKTFY